MYSLTEPILHTSIRYLPTGEIVQTIQDTSNFLSLVYQAPFTYQFKTYLTPLDAVLDQYPTVDALHHQYKREGRFNAIQASSTMIYEKLDLFYGLTDHLQPLAELERMVYQVKYAQLVQTPLALNTIARLTDERIDCVDLIHPHWGVYGSSTNQQGLNQYGSLIQQLCFSLRKHHLGIDDYSTML